MQGATFLGEQTEVFLNSFSPETILSQKKKRYFYP